jgi:hypothetical protein
MGRCASMTRTLQLLGLPVSTEDVRRLTVSLIADYQPGSSDLAGRLAKALDLHTTALALSPAERDLLLSVLEDPSEGLAELRGALLRDYEQRTREAS